METIKKSGYKYIGYIGHKQHILQPEDGQPAEVWISNKNHANYKLIYKNTHLEFMRMATNREILKAML